MIQFQENVQEDEQMDGKTDGRAKWRTDLFYMTLHAMTRAPNIKQISYPVKNALFLWNILPKEFSYIYQKHFTSMPKIWET